MLMLAPASDTPDAVALCQIKRATSVAFRRTPRESGEAPMLERTKTNSSLVELDRAFQYAVTLAWEDLKTPIEPRAIRVEYLSEPGSPVDHLSVWSVRAGGYQDLVCDFWGSTSVAHASGASFGNRHTSDKLAANLDFIM